MKKKFLTIIMMTVLVFSVTACGGGVLDAVGNLNDDKENTTSDTVVVDSEDNEDDLDDSVVGDVETVPTEEDVDIDAETEPTEDVEESEGTLVFDLSDSFVYNETDDCYYATDGITNVIYSTETNDGSFALVTQTMMEKVFEESYTEAFGEDIDITITSWEEMEVDGYEAILYVFEYQYMEIEFAQAQIAINGTDYFHYLTFTGMKGSEYMDDFQACIETMRFE